MSYQAAVEKGWKELEALADADNYSVSLMGDTYEVNLKDKSVFSDSCNIPAKEYLALLILHYLIGSFKNAFIPSGEWISFKEIPGGEIYYPAFKDGVIDALLRKYGNNPQGLFGVLERFKGAAKIDIGDAAIEIETFPEIKVRVVLWQADDEFGAEAGLLFDRGLTRIYSMEDITVFSHFVVNNL